MADFVQTMKNWKRMCVAMERERPHDACSGCPLEGYGCPAIYEDNSHVDFADVEKNVTSWAADHPEPMYETWLEFVKRFETGGRKSDDDFIYWMGTTSVPADIAEKLGVKPKEVEHELQAERAERKR